MRKGLVEVAYANLFSLEMVYRKHLINILISLTKISVIKNFKPVACAEAIIRFFSSVETHDYFTRLISVLMLFPFVTNSCVTVQIIELTI